MKPRDALSRLVSSPDGVVRLETEAEARAVKRAAARPDRFRVEEPEEAGGPWRVRYVDQRFPPSDA